MPKERRQTLQVLTQLPPAQAPHPQRRERRKPQDRRQRTAEEAVRNPRGRQKGNPAARRDGGETRHHHGIKAYNSKRAEKMVKDKVGVDIEDQLLFAAGWKMEEGRTMDKSGVEAKSMVILVSNQAQPGGKSQSRQGSSPTQARGLLWWAANGRAGGRRQSRGGSKTLTAQSS